MPVSTGKPEVLTEIQKVALGRGFFIVDTRFATAVKSVANPNGVFFQTRLRQNILENASFATSRCDRVRRPVRNTALREPKASLLFWLGDCFAKSQTKTRRRPFGREEGIGADLEQESNYKHFEKQKFPMSRKKRIKKV